VDLFEEIVKMRRAGRRAALATIVHTNGSIRATRARGCWCARMARSRDHRRRLRRGRGLAAAKEVMQKEAPRKMVFQPEQ